MDNKPGIDLSRVIAERNSPSVAEVLKRELEALDGTRLPLQQGLTRSSYTDGKDFGVTVLSLQPETNGVRAKVGILYRGLIAGCSCADDPTPESTIDEYCELELLIEQNGSTSIKLIPQQT